MKKLKTSCLSFYTFFASKKYISLQPLENFQDIRENLKVLPTELHTLSKLYTCKPTKTENKGKKAKTAFYIFKYD